MSRPYGKILRTLPGTLQVPNKISFISITSAPKHLHLPDNLLKE